MTATGARKAVRRVTRVAAKKVATRKAMPTKKTAKVSWLPSKYPALLPMAVLDECARAIDWYTGVLGGKQRLRLDMPDGGVGHCEIAFGDSVLMLGTASPQYPATTMHLCVYVKDCDATYAKAVAAGARPLQEPADQFYGDRTARFEDPFRNVWSLMTHVREVSVREMKAAMAKMGSPS